MFLLFIGCIQSCSTEESVLENNAAIKTVTKEEAILFLKKQETTISISGKKASLTFDFNKITQEKLTNTSELLTVVPVITKAKNQRTRALLLKVENSIETILYNEYSDASSTKNNFTGIILMTKLNGDFIRAYRIKDNAYVADLVPSKENKSSKNTLSKEIYAGEPNPLDEVNVYIYPNRTPFPYVSVNELGKVLPIADILWYSQGGGAEVTEEDDQIDISDLTEPLKCIYGKLSENSLEFKIAILKFDGEFPVSHLKFSINDNLPKDVYGKTMLPTNFVTEIQINGNSINSLSDLGKALVFAHEIIHAEIFRKMLSAAKLGTLTSDGSNMTVEQQTNYVNSLKDNFPGLYDYYFKRYKPSWNHEMMANHYRSTISDMIQNFDGNRLNKSTYDAIAWLGLGKLDKNNTTIAWDALSNDDKESIEKLIIENIYNGPKNCN